jgi:hypothetical protein
LMLAALTNASRPFQKCSPVLWLRMQSRIFKFIRASVWSRMPLTTSPLVSSTETTFRVHCFST